MYFGWFKPKLKRFFGVGNGFILGITRRRATGQFRKD